jgi:hypothetical protein
MLVLLKCSVLVVIFFMLVLMIIYVPQRSSLHILLCAYGSSMSRNMHYKIAQ